MTSAPLYMLDTNTAIFIINGRSPSARQTYLRQEPHASIVLSAITEGEIRFGLEKKPGATRLRSACEAFLATITVLAWDSAAAATYSKLRALMTTRGISLSVMDLLIASHAVASGATLVSNDRAFAQLTASLRIVDWAADL